MDARAIDVVMPGDVGIDSGRFSSGMDVLRAGIDEGAMPGAVVCGFRRGKMFVHEALGTRDGVKGNSIDTIYDLASITKPMATASSVIRLLEMGKITLMMTVPTILGDRAAHLAHVTVGHLLTHTSGLPAHRQLWSFGGKDLESAVD